MSDLIIEDAIGSRRGLVRLTVKAGDNLLACDEIAIAREKDRKRFTKALCLDRPGIVEADVAERLLAIAVKHATPPPQAEPDALEVTRLVRPELFITAQALGLAIPECFIDGGKPAARWRLHLLHSDDKREVRDLGHCIDLPGGRLWVHPLPAPPPASALPAWSAASRRAWLAGAEPPDPVGVFTRICEAIARFIDLPAERGPGVIATAALWTLLSYCYAAWPAIPYLFIGGPLGSGKSRFFDLLARLTFRPLSSSNMTAPALFRTLHDRGGTLLLDEAERLRESTPDAGEMRSILLAGYRQGGRATRLEPVGDSFRPVEFEVYGPKAVACIIGLPATLGSRCIAISMFRAPPGSEKPKRRIDENPALWQGLRDDLHALALGPLGRAALDLAERRDVCELDGRAYELWQPLHALAAWLEQRGAGGLLAVVREHALYAQDASRDDITPDVDELLLRLLAEAVQNLESPTPSDLLNRARAVEPDLFRNWAARTVSMVLKRYGIRATHGRDRRFRDVPTSALLKIQRAYGIDLGIAEPQTPAAHAAQTAQF